jgi:hypothetical protein
LDVLQEEEGAKRQFRIKERSRYSTPCSRVKYGEGVASAIFEEDLREDSEEHEPWLNDHGWRVQE